MPIGQWKRANFAGAGTPALLTNRSKFFQLAVSRLCNACQSSGARHVEVFDQPAATIGWTRLRVSCAAAVVDIAQCHVPAIPGQAKGNDQTPGRSPHGDHTVDPMVTTNLERAPKGVRGLANGPWNKTAYITICERLTNRAASVQQNLPISSPF